MQNKDLLVIPFRPNTGKIDEHFEPRLQRLLWIPIPLLLEDPEAVLDLQTVLDHVYDRAAYDMAMDYGSDPVPPSTK